MRKLALAIAGTIGVIALAGFLFLQMFPGRALSALQGLTASNAGFESKSVELDGYTAHYYVSGPEDAPVVVFLHGLIDDRNSFVPATEWLSGSLRVILPDLQGHGDNGQIPGRDYSIRGQVNFVEDLLEALDIGEVGIGGNSMGGHVAAAFALSHPDRVTGLVLLNATGLLLDQPPTYSAYPAGIDVSYMDNLYSHVFIKPPFIPRPIMRYLADDLNAKAPFYNTLIDEVVSGGDFRLDERIEVLETPTLIIWGTDDRLVPMRYAEAYHEAIPTSELRVFEAGHAPQIELPDDVGRALAAFLVAD